MGLEGLFVIAVAAAFYPLLGYPLVLRLIAALRPRAIARQAWVPQVTVLIPAYNEASCIDATIRNKLEQDYPAARLQIIVVSDASSDDTDAIVEGYGSRGVELLRQGTRQGKAAGLNEAVRRARGEILVFSDANSQFAPDAVRRLVENFADPLVGYVTGRLDYTHAHETSGRGSSGYMRYENWLRRLETQVDSVIGVNGGVDAMRRSLYSAVPVDQITDFVLPLRVIAAGFRVVFDERAQSRERANQEMGSEFHMRVRVALRALRGIVYARAALNLARRPLPAFCILSHKILRYLGFFFLANALLLNVLLATRSELFTVLLLAQLLLYLVALLGLARGLPRALQALTALPAYFVMSNAAFAVAVLRFVRGDTLATWKPRAG